MRRIGQGGVELPGPVLANDLPRCFRFPGPEREAGGIRPDPSATGSGPSKAAEHYWRTAGGSGAI